MKYAQSILETELKAKQSFVRSLDDSQDDLLNKVELAARRKMEAEEKIRELEAAIALLKS